MTSQPPRVFTPDWVERQKQRYSNSPAHSRPHLYGLWVEERAQSLRDRIEAWVAPLTSEEQAEVIPRLRDGNQFQQAYNELAVGDSLRSRGLQLAYEPELNGQTPDWLVCHAENNFRFILEILSSNPSEDRVSRDNEWDRFRLRLEALPGDALLYLQQPDPDDDAEMVSGAPTVARQKQIVRDVGRWLQSGPVEGAKFPVDGMTISYLGSGRPGMGVKCSPGIVAFWVDGEPLKEAIKEKASKYRTLTESMQVPLVVGVVPDFRTGRGMDEVSEAALGAIQTVMVRPAGEEEYRQHCYREANGLFSRYPNLSAVVVSEFGWAGMTHKVLRNPGASRPLPEGLIPEGEGPK